MKVLIIEDQKRLASTLYDVMQLRKYSADVCHDGESGYYSILSGIYDVVILDVMLPKMDGFTVLKKVREEQINTPVILLTAKTDLEYRVKGLNTGADYYLTKPFEIEELIACMRAVSRRKGEAIVSALSFHDITLNQDLLTLKGPMKEIMLSKKEYQVLEVLMQNQNQIVSKDILLTKIWGYECEVEDNTVEVYISGLRRKLNAVRSKTAISVMRNVGYYLVWGGE